MKKFIEVFDYVGPPNGEWLATSYPKPGLYLLPNSTMMAAVATIGSGPIATSIPSHMVSQVSEGSSITPGDLLAAIALARGIPASQVEAAQLLRKT
jgi:hypothetical protein